MSVCRARVQSKLQQIYQNVHVIQSYFCSLQLLRTMRQPSGNYNPTTNFPDICQACRFMEAHPLLNDKCQKCYHDKQNGRFLKRVQFDIIITLAQIEGDTTPVNDTKEKSKTNEPKLNWYEDDQFQMFDPTSYTERAQIRPITLGTNRKKFKKSYQKRYGDVHVKLRAPKYEKNKASQSRSKTEAYMLERIKESEKNMVPMKFKLIYSSGPPRKDICHHCSRKIGILGFQCPYCNLFFCKKDRLPELHQCHGDYQGKSKKKLKKQLRQNSIRKVHKGKVLKI